jgi:MinD-like ATPase involved in chromosome partitioning or flagellar assembly
VTTGGVPVLTAVSDPRWEADVVAGLAADNGVEVVRRCVDLADLLAAAAAGLARAVLLSADLRRLDRDALTRLAVAGVAVVGLVSPGDEQAERRLRQLGVAHVLPADAAPAEVSAAIVAAAGAAAEPPAFDYADPRAALPAPPHPREAEPPEVMPAAGQVLAVWGPTGAPGRTSVAVGIAAELAAIGVPTLLVDADVYGGSVAQLLGLLDEAPGVAAACRLANNGSLDLAGLAELAVEVRPSLRVLSGIARAERWPELRPSALDAVLGLARSLAAVVVVDCGFCLERDEELSYDTVAPRRNGATLAALEAADTVVAVAAADPVGLQRFVRGLADLREAVPGCAPVTVVTRVRAAAVGGGDAQAEIAAALSRYAAVSDVRFVPNDPASYDAAVAAGRTLPEIAPGSPARLALQSIAAGLAGRKPPGRRRRALLRRR